MLSVCSGVFVLGAAGLLDGRRCTAHWMNVDELRTRHPGRSLDPDVLFVDDGNLVTSAGTAAGIDACLHLVRRELGSAVVNMIARRMVVPPERDGGQRQYIEQPIPTGSADGLPPPGLGDQQNLHLDTPRSPTSPRGPNCPSAASPASSSPRPAPPHAGG